MFYIADYQYHLRITFQSALPPRSRCPVLVLSNIARLFQACGIASLGFLSFAELSRVSGGGREAQGTSMRMKRFLGAKVCQRSLSALDVWIGVDGARTGPRVEEYANTIILGGRRSGGSGSTPDMREQLEGPSDRLG